MMLVDTHTHLWSREFDIDREEILSSFEKEGMSFIIEIGADLESSRLSLGYSYKYSNVRAAVGYHPHDAKNMGDTEFEMISGMAKMERCVAVGEIGLDFYRNLSPKEVQYECFIKQLKLAADINKPVVFHIRDAYPEALEIIKKVGLPKAGGVVHSFLKEYETANRFLDLGLYLGLGGPITFKKNAELAKSVGKIPLESILSETDCPYLTPEPFRGKRNTPFLVRKVVEKISEIKKFQYDHVEQVLLENAKRLFKIRDM